MQNIVFLEVDAEDEEYVRGRFPEAKIIASVLEGKNLADECCEAQIVSTFIYTAFPAEVLKKLPKLKLLCTRSVGFNHIDIAACERQGITVCNVPDYGSHVIAEHVFALLLSTLRHVGEGADRTGKGVFDYHGLRGVALRGKTIGIVGTGKIGRCVARIAHGFGMKLLGVDICRTMELEKLLGLQYVSYEELLQRSDIVSLHLPSAESTRHVVDAKAFATMKDGAILVNTARGELIDSRAMLQALKEGKVRYALLDVLEHEKNFSENQELLRHPGVVATPHIAFYADDSMRNMYLDCFESMREFCAGKVPEHMVKPIQLVCDRDGVKKEINFPGKRLL